MRSYNTGIVYSDEKCIGCNKCIAACSVLGANCAIIQNGQNRVVVDSRKCVICGSCVSVCPQKARTYRDDSESFFTGAAQSQNISVIIDQSFFVLYKDRARSVLGWLRSLGVKNIYSSSLGAEISVWANVRYLLAHHEEDEAPFLVNCCPAFTLRVEREEIDFLKKLIPVHSPAFCTAIYAKKYLGDTSRMVFISPCVAVKDLISRHKGTIDASVSFDSIITRFNEAKYSGTESDPDQTGRTFGNIISAEDGMARCLALFFPEKYIIAHYNNLSPHTFSVLRNETQNCSLSERPLASTVVSCRNGCLDGPGTKKFRSTVSSICIEYFRMFTDSMKDLDIEASHKRNLEMLEKQFAGLDCADFTCSFQDHYQQPYRIPKSTYDEIFTAMHKNTVKKRSVNCGFCGYRSCMEMASAIAYGYNRKENCIHYMNEEMAFRYFIDPQTGIPNRAAFVRDAELLLKSNPAKKYVVCSGNVNKFKIIDDLYGFEAGDKVLHIVSVVLKYTVGSEGLCASLGGGNFALFFEYTPENMARLTKREFIDCSVLGIAFRVTMRFGLYVAQDRSESIMNMMNYATISMDKNSSPMENTFTMYTQEFHDQMKLETMITADMQGAMERQEFKLFFQPQYNPAGTLVGAEVLCRWIKDDGFIRTPDVFIPIFEKNGFIKKLDRYVWEKSFQAIQRWHSAGIKVVPISLNISRITLKDDDIISFISDLHKNYSLPPHTVHFEITESAYMNDQKRLIGRVNGIRNLGYAIAMDDFGSGYSSLNTLKDVPIDILKLDMGFLRESENTERGGTIINSVVRMAQDLKLMTIAEGVETQNQADFLCSIGCDVLQGFLYSRPVSQAEFERIIGFLK
ncbi:EAL domain-containing protein [uncultured Treponema sp.]|uniref:EAL domain-containing protein n=1 Tax=uncultured Treponema sp. TaxID=162155 RepID=UPI002598DDC6|nr:EAL domain-containing protein [uncultured Treponema sp.]